MALRRDFPKRPLTLTRGRRAWGFQSKVLGLGITESLIKWLTDLVTTADAGGRGRERSKGRRAWGRRLDEREAPAAAAAPECRKSRNIKGTT